MELFNIMTIKTIMFQDEILAYEYYFNNVLKFKWWVSLEGTELATIDYYTE